MALHDTSSPIVMKATLRSFVLLAFFTCCVNDDMSKDETLQFNTQKIYSCYVKTQWTASSIESKLVKTWLWKGVRYEFSSTPGLNETIWKGLTITFKPDHTGSTTGISPEHTFTWSVVSSGDAFTLVTEPFVPQLSGQVFFCDDIMVCSAVPLDGPDNYFAVK